MYSFESLFFLRKWFAMSDSIISLYVFLYPFQIRRKMREIMINQATSCDLKDLVRKFIPEMIGKEIEKATSSIYPLQNVFIRKVKILKAPKFDLGKLMEVCLLCPLLDLKPLLCSHLNEIHDI